MSLILQKFGGSSLADSALIKASAQTIAASYRTGYKVVVVVSAQGDMTDRLLKKANEINPDASKRELDTLVASGEQISSALLALALEDLGLAAVSLTGWQAGLLTDGNHSAARIENIDTTRIKKELNKNKIVIVAGFQGVTADGDISTLGRGGSDTSAVALAAALRAEICQIYTDVDGIYTADPRIVASAKKLTEISYDEMLELASLGANVLNNRSVELALKYNVKLQVLSSLHQSEGTYVKEESNVEKTLIRGVTRDNNIAKVSLMDVEDVPGKAYQIFSVLADRKINVDLIIQSVGREGKQDVSFTVASSALKDAINALKENNDVIKAREISYDKKVSKVSIVGSGVANNPGIAAGMFKVIFAEKINIQMIATSEIKISVLIAEADAERAVVALHDYFALGDS